jgi:hypothetical protein
MSGLLRRLAGQAIGEPPAVRPRAPALFAEPVAAHEGEEAGSPTLDLTRDRARAAQVDTGAAPRLGPEHPVPELPVNRDRQERADAPARSSMPEGKQPSPSKSRAALREPEPLLPPLAADRGGVAAASPASRADLRAGSIVRLTGTAERPLVPDSRDDEPNEVHVHIGRIEVTAVQEAPRVRESAARPVSSRRLEDYLRPRGAR